ncbi:ricin-type beta-trefoil lectin domain protein [Streptomyces griseoloalbus]|uniref:ricin-type beta-trefoil lectin domain protein n=1 Tax=Streptomyces griseoloalbus TaxID=67303 RepID=UPI0033A42DEC
MTHSAQQPPTSPRPESGTDGEETAAAATAAAATVSKAKVETETVTGVEPQSPPDPEPARAKTGAEGGTAATTEAEKKAAPGATTGPEAGTGPDSESDSEGRTGSGSASRTGPGSGAVPGSRPGVSAEAEAEGDPGAAAAAKSRLPALVRTMTATAIDRPQQRTGAVGRPGKAVLSGAAILGVLLVSVPLLMLGGDDDNDPRTTSAAAGTVLGGNGQEAPGDFAVTEPDTGSSGDDEKKTDKPDKPEKPVREAPASAPAKDKDEDEPKKDADAKDEPDKKTGGTTAGGAKDRPAQPPSGVTLSAPVSLRSHLSGRCIDVPDGDFGDGAQLWVWDCNNSEAQKMRFASDGTIRIADKCLDVANAQFTNGTPIQITWCNGNVAQQFVLNERHDLVNTVVGMCVDIKDNNAGNGAQLHLWTCLGTDNQKWSV